MQVQTDGYATCRRLQTRIMSRSFGTLQRRGLESTSTSPVQSQQARTIWNRKVWLTLENEVGDNNAKFGELRGLGGRDCNGTHLIGVGWPMKHRVIGRCKYFVMLHDSYIGYSPILFSDRRSESVDAAVEMVQVIESILSQSVRGCARWYQPSRGQLNEHGLIVMIIAIWSEFKIGSRDEVLYRRLQLRTCHNLVAALNVWTTHC